MSDLLDIGRRHMCITYDLNLARIILTGDMNAAVYLGRLLHLGPLREILETLSMEKMTNSHSVNCDA